MYSTYARTACRVDRAKRMTYYIADAAARLASRRNVAAPVLALLAFSLVLNAHHLLFASRNVPARSWTVAVAPPFGVALERRLEHVVGDRVDGARLAPRDGIPVLVVESRELP